MKISIVFPIHNEFENLQKILKEWSNKLKFVNNLEHEFVLVEDGSTDGTKNLIKDLEKEYKIKNLSLETQFISIPNKFVLEIDKILKNFQIRTSNYLNENYLQGLFKEEKIELSEMAYKSQQGYNVNEISIIPKNVKKVGFFEKFFQLFS